MLPTSVIREISALAALSAQQLANCCSIRGNRTHQDCPSCPGVNANTYQYGFIGASLHRQFGHDFHGYASYQFNRLGVRQLVLRGLASCSNTSNRHAITFGLDWTPGRFGWIDFQGLARCKRGRNG